MLQRDCNEVAGMLQVESGVNRLQPRVPRWRRLQPRVLLTTPQPRKGPLVVHYRYHCRYHCRYHYRYRYRYPTATTTTTTTTTAAATTTTTTTTTKKTRKNTSVTQTRHQC